MIYIGIVYQQTPISKSLAFKGVVLLMEVKRFQSCE